VLTRWSWNRQSLLEMVQGCLHACVLVLYPCVSILSLVCVFIRVVCTCVYFFARMAAKICVVRAQSKLLYVQNTRA
jgi:hypothetical protein